MEPLVQCLKCQGSVAATWLGFYPVKTHMVETQPCKLMKASSNRGVAALR